MDASTLIHPMTAGDLGAGAKIVGYLQRGDGPQLQIHEVLAVRRNTEGGPLEPASYPNETVEVTIRDDSTGEAVILRLRARTPLLVTHTLIV